MKEYIFGKNKIILHKGAKTSGDYLIFHNGIQIRDEALFKYILLNTSDEAEAKQFMNCFTNAPFAKLEKDKIEISKSLAEIEKIYNYCIDCELKFELKEFLFVAMLRCDIDNICYPPPFYNGCIRILSQILLVLSHKFNWSSYTKKSKIGTDIAKDVANFGFSGDRKDFKRIYEQYLTQGI